MKTKNLFMMSMAFVLISSFSFAEEKKEAPATPTNEKVASKLKALEKAVDDNIIGAGAVKHFAKKNLLQYCTNAIFVDEVKKQNAKKVPFSEIDIIDKKWIKSSKNDPFKKEMLKTACSNEIKSIQKKYKSIIEAFVMDNQGALVGITNITSDYMQGDEDKWIKSYDNGKGGIHINAAEYDPSVKGVLQQISFPIIDPEGNVIGAVTWGLALDKINWKE